MTLTDEPGDTTTTITPSGTVAEVAVASVGTARPLRADLWRRFRKNRLAVIGLAIIGLLLAMAIFAPLIAPYDFDELGPDFRQPPSATHWFGTDTIGRDVFSRVVYGARVSLRVGILSTIIALTLGVLLGAVAGFFGGLLDTLIMRTTDVFLSIPYVILAVAIATVLGKGLNTIILVLGFTGWLAICRIVRSSFLSLRQLEYVQSATAIGASRGRVMFRHILPNAAQPIIVYGALAVGGAILSEAALSFIGVGAVDPTPAWGLMIRDAKGLLTTAPHALLFPGGALALTVLAFQFVGDGLRDALDAKLK